MAGVQGLRVPPPPPPPVIMSPCMIISHQNHKNNHAGLLHEHYDIMLLHWGEQSGQGTLEPITPAINIVYDGIGYVF